jgi:hypothetical protein
MFRFILLDIFVFCFVGATSAIRGLLSALSALVADTQTRTHQQLVQTGTKHFVYLLIHNLFSFTLFCSALGSAQSSAGATACTACTSGFVASAPNLLQCAGCQAGRYANGTSLTFCSIVSLARIQSRITYSMMCEFLALFVAVYTWWFQY